MENVSDLDAILARGPIDQEVSRLVNSPESRIHAISAVPEVIRSRYVGDFLACGAAGALGMLGNVNHRLGQQRLVSEPRLFTKMLVRPCQNRSDVLLRRWRDCDSHPNYPLLG